MELSQLQAFVTVLDSGSLLHASRALDISRTTVHARISALEDNLGMELLVRTHRGVQPTEFGRHFAEGARRLLRDAEQLAQSTIHQGEEVLGELYVRLSVGFPPQVGAMLMARIIKLYPDLQIVAEVEADPTRELPSDVDVILHFGPPRITGAYRTFVLMRFPELLLCSRSYAEDHGLPRTLAELGQRRLLSWSYPGFDGRSWPLRDGGSFAARPALISNDAYTIRSLAAAGHGIALLPDAEIAKGAVPGEDFVSVLPELVGRESGVWVLLPDAQADTPRNRATVDLLRNLPSRLFGSAGESPDYPGASEM